MTPLDWATSTDPDRMLAEAGNTLTDRQLLLFAAGAARRLWDRLPAAAQMAVVKAEAAAEVPGAPVDRNTTLQASMRSMAEVFLRATLGYLRPPLPGMIRQVATTLRLMEAHADLSMGQAWLRYFAEISREHPGQAALLRCVAGNPFAPVAFDPDWRTSDVLALARGIAGELAFDRLPILADALQDAGCADDRLLTHLRRDPIHTRGCHALDHILGRS